MTVVSHHARKRAKRMARGLDPRPRSLPDFVIVGAQRAGTTSLFAQIASHPSVVPPQRKELHYFDREPRPVRHYRAQFPRRATLEAVATVTGIVVTGEATPFYLAHPAVPLRMQAVVPDVRIVVLLRDPVARAVSGYHLAVRFADEERPIHEALDPDNQEARSPHTDHGWYDDPHCPTRLRGYLTRGHYAEQLVRWFACYPRDQILILETAALRAGRVLPEVLDFLDLPTMHDGASADRNVGEYPPAPPEVARRLADYFRPHNERLFRLLGVEWDWSS